MKTSYFKPLSMVAAIMLGLSACGGSSSPNDEGPGSISSMTISGEVMAPGGAIAQIEQDKPVLLAVLDYMFPVATAAITGLTGVPNATVELIRISNNGDQLGGVLATTTTNGQGEYTLTLPNGIEPAANLVVQISGTTKSLRAVVSTSSEAIDISPVSQFILDTIIDEGLNLSQVNVEIVQKLVNDVSALSINFTSTTLAGIDTEIKNNTTLLQTVSQEVSSIANTTQINGAWDVDMNQGEGRMLVFSPNGTYLVYSKNEQDCPNGGVEYGTYTYHGAILEVIATVDENGQCGLVGTDVGVGVAGQYSVTITDNGNQINIDSGDPEDGVVSFSRVTDGNPNSLVGGWDASSGLSDITAIVFYPGGNYAHWQGGNCVDAQDNAAPGVEYGTYQDNGDGTVSVNILFDSNDCGLGFGTGQHIIPDPGDTPASFNISNNVWTLSGPNFEGDIETFVIDRLETSDGSGPTLTITPSSGVGDGTIASMTLTSSSAVTINKSMAGERAFPPELLGNNTIQVQYGNGNTENLNCWGHHYNTGAGEYILHCTAPSNGADIYLGLSSSNTQVISFEHEDVGAYFQFYWLPEASGTTQITAILPFDNSSATLSWNVEVVLQ